jgi:hypothetical protein
VPVGEVIGEALGEPWIILESEKSTERAKLKSAIFTLQSRFTRQLAGFKSRW